MQPHLLAGSPKNKQTNKQKTLDFRYTDNFIGTNWMQLLIGNCIRRAVVLRSVIKRNI